MTTKTTHHFGLHGSIIDVGQKINKTSTYEKPLLSMLPKKRNSSVDSSSKKMYMNRSLSNLSKEQTSAKRFSNSSNTNSNHLNKEHSIKSEEKDETVQIISDLQIENERLKQKLNESLKRETDYKMKVDELLNNNESYKIKCENFASQLTSINTTHELEIKNFKSQKDEEISQLKFVQFNELKVRDDKLALLKKQIAASFKDNSWERQLQIDELTKELKNVHEEYNLLKQKYKSATSQPSGKHCQKCSSNEKLVEELVNLIRKSQKQVALQKELATLISSNKTYAELFARLNLTHDLNK